MSAAGAEAWRSRIVEHGERPAKDFTAHPQNPRRHPESQREGIRGSLSGIGWVTGVIVNKTTGHTLDGHARIEEALVQGEETPVPYTLVELTEEEERVVLASLDPLSALAEYDREVQRELLTDLPAPNPEMQKLLDDLLKQATPQEAPEQALDLAAARRTLASRFIVPPFSVLDARQGYWQERKRAWIALGIESELGRGGNLLSMSQTVLEPDPEKRARRFGQTPNMGGRPDNPEAMIPRYYDKLNGGMSREQIIEEGERQNSRLGKNTQAKGGLLIQSDSGNDSNYYYRKQEAERIVGRPLSTADFQRLYVGVFKSEEGLSAEELALVPALREAWARGLSSYTGTSIFDPVLCEVAYRWFSPMGGLCLDPFAGGSVRGVVAGMLGRHYVGIDLRAEQVEANRLQAVRIFREREGKVTDPEALTPVELRGDIWVKRDDLFEVNGARGGKARACLALLKGAPGAVAAGNRLSPMVSRVARVAQALGIPCRAHAAGSKELAPEELDAVAHGAEMVKIPGTNYLSAVKSRARKDAEERGWVFVPFGLECPEYFEMTKRQVRNVPEHIKRIVLTAGSGMTTAAVLAGLEELGRSDVKLLAIRVGSDPIPLIDRWAPEGWRDRVTIVTAPVGFEKPEAETEFWGIELDPHYEAKAAKYAEPGDLFWSIAIRAEASAGVEPVAAEPAELPAWTKGYPMELLKALAGVFREHDAGHTFGAFTSVKENTVADWLAAGKLHALEVEGEPVAIVVASEAKAASTVEDFSGAVIGQIERQDVVVRRIAARQGHHGLLPGMIRELARAGRALWVELWQEKPEDRAVARALGLSWAGSKIRASSEIVGVWTSATGVRAPSLVEQLALVPLDVPPLPVQALRERLEGLSWADHYSSYNKGHSWSAISLRGYGGQQDFIIKPSEMSKKWKAENAEKLAWELADTPLRAALPEAEELIAAVPGVKHRIRLMKLAQGEGELTRHADITDPDAGVAPGRLLRIHIPIQTNPGVMFEQWLLDGRRIERHMPEGSAVYLDTRKPHTAINHGEQDRIHLVMDVESNQELLAMLGAWPESRATDEIPLPAETDGAVPVDFTSWQGPRQAESHEVRPRWVEGDARNLLELAPGEYDFLLSCPPYYNLEVYSEDPQDLSCAKDYGEFRVAHAQIIRDAVSLLKPNRFAMWVVSEIRNSSEQGGFCRGFVRDTIEAFEAAGARLYNECALVTSVGSLPIRVARHFESARKLGRTHQSVLVFCKGDPRKATLACGPVDLSFQLEGADAAVDSGSDEAVNNDNLGA